MRGIVALALLLASPAFAEGRQDILLDCVFGAEPVTVLQDGAGYRAKVGDETFPAGLAQPGPDGRVVGIFAMLDAGPIMIAVETTDGRQNHIAEITAATQTADGLASRTTRGTCTEATP